MRLKFLPVLLLLLRIGLLPARAQTKPAGQSAAAPPDFSREAFVVEHYTTRITAEDDGSANREVTAEARIQADAGVKAFAVLNFVYTSANDVVDVEYVRVRKPDGTVVNTPDYNIQDMPGEVTRAAPMYSDVHEKHIAVKGLATGDTLEYLVRFRTVKPQVLGHFWYEHTFLKNGIVKDERLEISVPAAKYVKVVSPDFKPEVKEEAGRRIYRWTSSNLERKEKDPRERPQRRLPAPSVQVTTFASWEDVGRWYAGLQKDPLEVTPAIRYKAAELTTGLQTDDEKIRALYNFVALQFHYIGLDFGIGRYQPHPADDVLGNGYGDCKDKHTLLASLLKAAGYDAWPALIHSARTLDPDVPSPAQFNHVISVVPSGGKLIWLDTTAEVAPYQLLMIVLRDKQALVIPTDKPPVLMKTPADPPMAGRQDFSLNGKLGDDGLFTAHVEQTYCGDGEVALRGAFRRVSQAEWKELAQRFSYGLGFGGDVSNVTVTPPEQTDQPFHVAYDYSRKKYGEWERRQIIAPLPPMGVEASDNPNEKPPTEAVLLGQKGEISYHSTLELPPGYSISVPRGLDLSEPYAEYHTTNSLKGNVLDTTRRLVIKQNEVAVGDWESYRKFGKAVSDDEYRPIHLLGEGVKGPASATAGSAGVDDEFEKASEALKSRDNKRAQELLEKVVAADPRYPGAHFNLGLALMAQRETSEALAEFRKEEEVSPENSVAYQAAASYLMYSGQRNEAIKEWRKLLKVDPGNRDAALTLSGLLNGEKKYSEAAAALEDALQASPDSPSLEMALGEMYVKAGDADKGVTHMRKAMENPSGGASLNSALLNDAAYLLAERNTHLDVAKEYAEKALAELDQRSLAASDSDSASLRLAAEFEAVWDTVGWVYFQMGDTSRAENFVHAAWVLGQQAVVGDHLAQIYVKQGKRPAAEHVYEQALAVYFHGPVVLASGQNPVDTYHDDRQQILDHYEKLTGRKSPPLAEITRLPNGQWTKSPGDELRDTLQVKISKTTTVSGVAEFTVVLAAGKVEAARYVHGDEQLQTMTHGLSAATYPMEFPAGSRAKVARSVRLTCLPASGCIAQMLTPDEVPVRGY